MKKSMKKDLKKILIVSIIMFLGILGTFIVGKTFAKYLSDASGNTGIGVAVPIYRNSIEEITVPLSTMSPGDTFSYNFYITNENTSNKVSEVSLDYTISLTRSTNLPVTINLHTTDSNTNLLDTNLTTGTYTMPHGVSTVHNYVLTLTWDESYDDYRWNNTIEAIAIYVNVVQKPNT